MPFYYTLKKIQTSCHDLNNPSWSASYLFLQAHLKQLFTIHYATTMISFSLIFQKYLYHSHFHILALAFPSTLKNLPKFFAGLVLYHSSGLNLILPYTEKASLNALLEAGFSSLNQLFFFITLFMSITAFITTCNDLVYMVNVHNIIKSEIRNLASLVPLGIPIA